MRHIGFIGVLLLGCVLATGLVWGASFRDAIVAAWTFEEGSGKKIVDVTGNGHDGELKGGASWEAGRFGKALHFDGSSGYVEIPFADDLKVLNEGDFTLAAWVYADAMPGENKEVFQQGDANGTGRTWLFIASGSGEFRSYLGGGTTASGISIEPEKWFHFAVTVVEGGASDTIQVYIDGDPAGDPSNRGMEDSRGPYFIGCHKNLTNFWDGLIDEVALIRKALDPDEMKDLMNNGLTNVLAVAPSGKLPLVWAGLKR